MTRWGVLLAQFGSPDSPESVAAYLARVTQGRVEPRHLEGLAARYRRHWPAREMSLSWQAQRLAQTLEEELAMRGQDIPVRVGYRFSEPSMASAVGELQALGVNRLAVWLPLPWASSLADGPYVSLLRETLPSSMRFCIMFPRLAQCDWYASMLACRLRAALEESHGRATVMFTAHSMPLVGEATLRYQRGYLDFCGSVARLSGISGYHVAYQSRGANSRCCWLEPATSGVLDVLRSRGRQDLLVVPLGFSLENFELTYDLDIELRQAWSPYPFRRLKALGTEREFAAGIARDFILQATRDSLGE